MTGNIKEKVSHKPNNRDGTKEPGDSQFWIELMNAKPDFLRYESFQIKKGGKSDSGGTNG
jgi:hypothetical protein